MDTIGHIESTNRRRWHLITGSIICTFVYVLTMILLSAYIV